MNKKVALCLISICLSAFLNITYAQLFNGDTSTVQIPDRSPNLRVDPLYPGGSSAFLKDLHTAISAETNGKIKECSVSLAFSIEANSSIRLIMIKKSAGKKMDVAITNALNKLQPFRPATMDGNPITIIYSLTFVITKTSVTIGAF